MVDARALLIENLDVVDRIIGLTCRRQRLDQSDAEEFASTVKLKLVENDYAVIRKFQGRSAFSSFLTVVVQRMLLDYRIHAWGKWHPSAEARRLGENAIEIEKMLLRDGRTMDEVFARISAHDPAITMSLVTETAARLPPRPPRRRLVNLDEAAEITAPPADTAIADRQNTCEQISRIVRSFISRLPKEERLIFQLRFESGMTVAQIARALHIDQKQSYRVFERHLRDLRAELTDGGITAEEAAALIGDHGVVLDFRPRNPTARPSLGREKTIADDQEVST